MLRYNKSIQSIQRLKNLYFVSSELNRFDQYSKIEPFRLNKNNFNLKYSTKVPINPLKTELKTSNFNLNELKTCSDEEYYDIKVEKLMFAASNGDLDTIKYWIKSGENINITKKNGSTALMFAVTKGHLEIVKYLTENGANLNIENKLGLSALVFAAVNDNLEVFKYLLANGAYLTNNKDNVSTKEFTYLSTKSKIYQYLKSLEK